MGINMAAVAEVASSTLDKEKQKFDSLSEAEKEQKFLSTIDEIKMSQDFQNFEKWRNRQSVKKKMQYYKDWEAISVKGSINYASKAPGTLDVSLNPLKRPKVRWLPNPSLNPFKNPVKNIEQSVETSVYEQFPWLMRLWVSFWLLKKPRILPEKTLLKNIATDAHTLNQNLWIFKKVCSVVPQLMALYPIIQKLLPYTEWYEKNWASLIQERIKNKETKKAEESTTYSLSHVEQSIVKSEIENNNGNNNWQQNSQNQNEWMLDTTWGNTVATNSSWWLSENAW